MYATFIIDGLESATAKPGSIDAWERSIGELMDAVRARGHEVVSQEGERFTVSCGHSDVVEIKKFIEGFGATDPSFDPTRTGVELRLEYVEA